MFRFLKFPSSLLECVGVIIEQLFSVSLFTCASLYERCISGCEGRVSSPDAAAHSVEGSALCGTVSPPPLSLLRCSCDVISVGQRTASAY